jgi:hypothetical protein
VGSAPRLDLNEEDVGYPGQSEGLSSRGIYTLSEMRCRVRVVRAWHWAGALHDTIASCVHLFPIPAFPRKRRKESKFG